jgi:glyoxylase-like metal-dependent hydrolase (beta-lactamase superfamily II)
MNTKDFSRRKMLAVTGVGVAAAMATRLAGPLPAQAHVPVKGEALPNPPAFYNFMHGDVQITMVSDGPLGLGDGRPLIKATTVEDVSARLEAAFLPTDTMVLQQNIPILKIGGKKVIIDTGMGASTMFGDTTGRLVKNMQAAGIDPTTIDAVVLSHCHPDHAGGMVYADGKPVFPFAEVFVNQADFEFWTDEAKLTGDAKPFIEYARSNLLPYKDKMTFIKGGEEFLPGLQSIDAPGHTVGHTIFMVTSGDKPLAITADCAHHHVLFLEQPKFEFGYDTDAKQAVATRLKIWDMLATDRIPFIAYHFPWPGLGNLAKAGDGYRFVQTPVSL